MKKMIALMSALLMLLLSGCSVQVDSKTFRIPAEKIDTIEVQREYIDDDGKTTYRKKVIENKATIEELCEMVNELDVTRVANEETPTIVGFPLVVIFRGEKDHYLIVNKHVVFYDSLAYLYTDSDIYDSFLDYYSELSEKEVDTVLEWG